jgi:N-acetylglucosaminyldiphosphoundecaprenol N-acetyl-beta-D-mannosaminyltransferase
MFMLRFFMFCRRTLDFLLALLFLAVLFPFLWALYLLAVRHGSGICKEMRLGRWGTVFGLYRFNLKNQFLAGIPVLVNILKGQMSFVGPRPVSPDEISPSERHTWKRYDIRPGLVSPWWLRQRANIAYSSEAALDAEYAETHSIRGDMGMLLRALPALAYGHGTAVAPSHITLLDIPIDNLTMAEASDTIVALAFSRRFHQVCFVNADCVNISFRNQEYKNILCSAKQVLADGIGVRLAGHMLHQNIRENVNGTDMLPFLCSALDKAGLGLYLLGGLPGVPERTAAWISAKYPSLEICGVRNGYFSSEEEAEVLDTIRQSGAQVLLVAMGVPRQEKWIFSHRDKLDGTVCIGVGGLFDFYSGRIPRAPVWMRELGMEWLYRFLQEPRRMWRRYFVGNAIFLWRVWRGKKRAPRASLAEGRP